RVWCWGSRLRTDPAATYWSRGSPAWSQGRWRWLPESTYLSTHSAFLNALFAVIPRRLPARSNDAEMICAAFLSLCRETRRTVDVAHLCSGGSGPVHVDGPFFNCEACGG